MNKRQIERIMATEKRDTSDPRSRNWHYRRACATANRDAIWQYANRSTHGEWRTIPTPPMELLLRLVPLGRITDRDFTYGYGRVTWQGFHDPDEYERGY
jgi:hypothetical protein